jgi:hypothetical protein
MYKGRAKGRFKARLALYDRYLGMIALARLERISTIPIIKTNQ